MSRQEGNTNYFIVNVDVFNRQVISLLKLGNSFTHTNYYEH